MMATGVTSFLTAPEASKALVPLGGALWLLDVPSAGGATPFGASSSSSSSSSSAGAAPLLLLAALAWRARAFSRLRW